MVVGGQGSRVKSFAASADCRVAVVVLHDSTVTVWDMADMKVRGKCVHDIQRFNLRFSCREHAFINTNCNDVLVVSCVFSLVGRRSYCFSEVQQAHQGGGRALKMDMQTGAWLHVG